MDPTIAIVGSGPSGCYLAQALRRAWPGAAIVVFDRLPVPYGLVRYGVAPDHQGTKSVTRQFDRLFEREGVVFLGNVDVEADMSLAALRAAFDIVALATGLHGDRPLGIPGDDHPRVQGAGRLTRLVNAHPDEAHDALGLGLGRRAVIVGHGNVAIDVLRLLIKADLDFLESDVDDEARAALLAVPLERIDIVGRAPAGAARFDVAMIRELGRIDGVAFEVGDLQGDVETDAVAADRIAALRALPAAPGRLTVGIRFGWSPVSIEGGERPTIAFAATDGSTETLTIAADSIVTAIGFTGRAGRDVARAPLQRDGFDLAAGELDDGLYCTGWFRRGPRGTIPDNRTDARMVAARIVAGWGAGRMVSGPRGLAALPADVLDRAVRFAGWQAIDATERAEATAGRLRRKIRHRARLLDIAAGGTTREGLRS